MAISPTDPVDVALRTDTTPMIDCVFLMIVFFVCCDFQQLEGRLPAWLPRDVGGSSKIEPEPMIDVQIHCDAFGTERSDPLRRGRHSLEGHRVHWVVGARTVTTWEALQRELARLAQDPGMTVRDRENPTRRRLVSCLVEPYPGTVHDDAVRTADACRAAGFRHVDWGGGLGPRPR